MPLAQAAVMLVLSNDLALPVAAAFLPGDPVTGRGGAPEVLFEVPIGAFFASFGLTQYLQYRRIGPWRDYPVGEATYIWLRPAPRPCSPG